LTRAGARPESRLRNLAVLVPHARLVGVEGVGGGGQDRQVHVQEHGHVVDLLRWKVGGDGVPGRGLDQPQGPRQGGGRNGVLEQLCGERGAAGLIVLGARLVDRVVQHDGAVDREGVSQLIPHLFEQLEQDERMAPGVVAAVRAGVQVPDPGEQGVVEHGDPVDERSKRSQSL
jgi:hypothetical protein